MADLEVNSITNSAGTGAVDFPKGIESNKLIIGSGGGISFDNGSNYLDDYEEGTFTVTTAGDATGVIANTAGEYTKVGNIVTVRIVFQVTTNFTSNAISGLPYHPSGTTAISSVASVTPVLTQINENVVGFCSFGSSGIAFKKDNNANSNHLPNTTNNIYRLGITYRTA